MPEHNAVLVGDTLSALNINYRWRRLIVDVVISYLDSLNEDNVDPEYIELHNQFLALIEDMYN